METNTDVPGPGNLRVHPGQTFGALSGFDIRQYGRADVVSSGTVLEDDARAWFLAFFEGCDRFVPVFDATDCYDVVRGRSSVLFDIIVIYGARTASGAYMYQNLYGILRQHTSDLVLRLSDFDNQVVTIEDIQAILIIASYSESGGILCDIAIRASVRVGLPSQLEVSLGSLAEREPTATYDPSVALRAARAWCCTFNLDMILSLDGGKPPSIILRSPRRIKSLLKHPQCTILDIRLFAQVELNAVRSSSHTSLINAALESNAEYAIMNAIRGTMLDLDMWLSEWQDVVISESNMNSEHDTLSLNLRVQHAWAILALHLRALTALGIENIAVMTETQRKIAIAAKRAAEQHLQLVLTQNVDNLSTSSNTAWKRPYIDSFPYAMEFVWAKNAFCVLIMLRLGILLADPLDQIRARLAEANDFLHELDRVGVGMNISYTRILSKTVRKCESTIQASLEPHTLQDADNSTGDDFESFVPKQFVFEWDFPGLHLCYIPLDWRDLFQDIDGAA